MILELFMHRGLGMYIDGESPAAFLLFRSFGGDECGRAYGIRCREYLGSKRGVPIGRHRVLGWDLDIPFQDFMCGHSSGGYDYCVDPKEITLITEDGEIKLKVTDVKNCPPDLDALPITLANGEVRSIDESTTYLRAET